jgi:phosphoserine phosphatase RsbU/P
MSLVGRAAAKGWHRVFGTVGVRLAIATIVSVAIVSASAFLQLRAADKERLIQTKALSSATAVGVLAEQLAPVIDFGDSDDVGARLASLRGTRDIIGAAVWFADERRAPVRWDEGTAFARPSTTPSVTREADAIVVAQSIIGASGTPTATLGLAFSLRHENETHKAGRSQVFWLTLLLAELTAAALIGVTRWQVVGPIRKLVESVRRAEAGDAELKVDAMPQNELGELARALEHMGEAVAFRQERLRKDVQLAQRIQTSILPRALVVPGLEIAAEMRPADEVGGDYYDVIPETNGAWFAIGDVAGHGVDAGLVMMMLQGIVAGVVHHEPDAGPASVLASANGVLYTNVRDRLQRDDHATLTLMRYEKSGHLTFAGAHEDLIVFRHMTGQVEVVRTEGPWVGAIPDIHDVVREQQLHLDIGDVLVLHTDGVTEARKGREEFGLERLCGIVEEMGHSPVDEIVQAVQESVVSWMDAQMDDITVVALRRTS